MLDVGQTCVDRAEVADEILGQIFASSFARRDRPDRAQDCCCGPCCERERSATRDEVTEQCEELIGDTNSLRSKVRPAFVEHREHRRVVLAGYHGCVALQDCDARSRGPVDHMTETGRSAVS